MRESKPSLRRGALQHANRVFYKWRTGIKSGDPYFLDCLATPHRNTGLISLPLQLTQYPEKTKNFRKADMIEERKTSENLHVFLRITQVGAINSKSYSMA